MSNNTFGFFGGMFTAAGITVSLALGSNIWAFIFFVCLVAVFIINRSLPDRRRT